MSNREGISINKASANIVRTRARGRISRPFGEALSSDDGLNSVCSSMSISSSGSLVTTPNSTSVTDEAVACLFILILL